MTVQDWKERKFSFEVGAALISSFEALPSAAVASTIAAGRRASLEWASSNLLLWVLRDMLPTMAMLAL